jgi:hypothetical protein
LPFGHDAGGEVARLPELVDDFILVAGVEDAPGFGASGV